MNIGTEYPAVRIFFFWPTILDFFESGLVSLVKEFSFWQKGSSCLVFLFQSQEQIRL